MAIHRPAVVLASAMLFSACVARSLDDAESESSGGTTVTSDEDGDDDAANSEPPTTGASATTSGAEASAGSGVPPEPMTSTTTTTTTEPMTTTESMTTGPVTTTEPVETTGAPDELSCESYCELYESGCQDFSEYSNIDECLAQCAQWPVGLPSEAFDDSLGCRTYHVAVANMADPDMHCPHAGPSGADLCVDPEAPQCASYCDTYFKACTDKLNLYASVDECLTQCAEWYPGTHNDTQGDSIGCRTYHATVALDDPPTHCPHAGPGGGQVCETQQ